MQYVGIHSRGGQIAVQESGMSIMAICARTNNAQPKGLEDNVPLLRLLL